MRLTPAESQVLMLAANGLSTTEIAKRRRRAKGTIKAQMQMIYIKLGANNRAQAVAVAIAWRILRAGKGGVVVSPAMNDRICAR